MNCKKQKQHHGYRDLHFETHLNIVQHQQPKCEIAYIHLLLSLSVVNFSTCDCHISAITDI
jgi:hypothetical protein